MFLAILKMRNVVTFKFCIRLANSKRRKVFAANVTGSKKPGTYTALTDFLRTMSDAGSLSLVELDGGG